MGCIWWLWNISAVYRDVQGVPVYRGARASPPFQAFAVCLFALGGLGFRVLCHAQAYLVRPYRVFQAQLLHPFQCPQTLRVRVCLGYLPLRCYQALLCAHLEDPVPTRFVSLPLYAVMVLQQVELPVVLAKSQAV